MKLSTKDMKTIATVCGCSIATVFRAIKGDQDTILLRRVRKVVAARLEQLEAKKAFLAKQDADLGLIAAEKEDV
jgi:aminoglycoside phosphotransferase